MRNNRKRQEIIRLQTEQYFRDWLSMIAFTRFKWEGIPLEMPERFIEKILHIHGMGMFYKHPTHGKLVFSKCTASNRLNIYDEPIAYIATDSTGAFAEVPREECVIVRNNILSTPIHNYIDMFAYRFADLQGAMDVNVNGQKTPVILSGDEKAKLGLELMFKKVRNNEPAIYVNKGFDPDALKAINFQSPYVVDKLTAYQHELMNEFLTFIGINNTNTQKRERLISDEVTSNDEIIRLCAETALMERQKACEELKQKFGVDVDVFVRVREEKGGEETGELYSETKNPDR